MKRLTIVLSLAAVLASGQVKEERRVFVHSESATVGATHDILMHAAAPVEFLSSDFAWEEKLVKGAPYSAEAITESTQMLVDGNRITRKNTSLIYRDGEGRTRREQSIEAIGPWAAGQAHKSIFINDPVGGVNYILDPQNKTAMKLSLPKGMEGAGTARMMIRGGMIGGSVHPPAGGAAGVSREVTFERFIGPEGANIGAAGKQNFANTPLGKQTVEGVAAEGTRTTVTIAAGEIGNDRPIETVSERWYSPELQTVVMTKRSDPRAGDSTYKLTNIRRAEPGKSLFEVPSDYTVKEENVMMRKMRVQKSEETTTKKE